MSEVDVAALRDHWEDEKRIGQYFREHVEGEAEAVLALLAEIEGLRERLARQDAVIEAARDWYEQLGGDASGDAFRALVAALDALGETSE